MHVLKRLITLACSGSCHVPESVGVCHDLHTALAFLAKQETDPLLS